MTDPSSWLLTKAERANPRTVLDDRHPGDEAWSGGNLVRPLIHGSVYFRELYDALEAAREGDLVVFTDWQGDADERLTGEPGSEVLEVLGRADERGVDVRGLVWRSHLDQTGFFATENRHLGEQLQKRGAEVLLDMRVRTGGSHHQKFVVIRYRDDPTRDVAFVGGMDLAHNRRDDADHGGDPQPQPLTEEYGSNPPWHDAQVAIQGPAVHDVETVFRERWEDPTPLSQAPWRRIADKLRGLDTSPDPLPEQWPAPPEAGHHVVQLLRTYPNLRHGRDYPFARGGERSVARGYSKAVARAEVRIGAQQLDDVVPRRGWRRPCWARVGRGVEAAGARRQALRQRGGVVHRSRKTVSTSGPSSSMGMLIISMPRLSVIAKCRS